MIHLIVPIIDNNNFNKYLKPSINFKTETNVLLVNGDAGICFKYNEALSNIKDQLNDDDIVIFSHDDITIRDEYMPEKLKMFFELKPNIALAGVIGTSKYSKEGGWWHDYKHESGKGKIIQGKPDGTKYLMEVCNGMFDDVVLIDGCIMFMRGSIAKNFRFESDLLTRYHFYDYDTCFQLLNQGYDIGIIDILVEHKSHGELTDDWYTQKEIFQKKWNNLQYPITKDSFK